MIHPDDYTPTFDILDMVGVETTEKFIHNNRFYKKNEYMRERFEARLKIPLLAVYTSSDEYIRVTENQITGKTTAAFSDEKIIIYFGNHAYMHLVSGGQTVLDVGGVTEPWDGQMPAPAEEVVNPIIEIDMGSHHGVATVDARNVTMAHVSSRHPSEIRISERNCDKVRYIEVNGGDKAREAVAKITEAMKYWATKA